MQTILVCDDDKQIVEAIDIYLTGEGFQVIKAYDGYEALELLENNSVDLMIVDVMMPGLDGIRTTLKVRETSSIPIIILSAKSEDADKILGLNIGADDYITKPFSPKILVAKIKALLRRSQNEQETHEADDGVAIDRDARQVVLDGKNVDLSPTEYKLLNYLVSNTGKALSRRQILTQVWNYDHYGDLRTVDTHINRLRIKLGDKGRYIRTVRGYGYRYDGK